MKLQLPHLSNPHKIKNLKITGYGSSNIIGSKVYVGTYGKYNNGSLFGAWLDLSDIVFLCGISYSKTVIVPIALVLIFENKDFFFL